MSLAEKYKKFAVAPTADALADSATIHYVPTLTSVSTAPAIVKHLKAQEEQLDSKYNFLHVVEGPSSISVETETTISFKFGGGAYTPGLDDNFTADRIVTLPIVHNVGFDASGAIQQIRIYWDQASLLKSLEVIGSRGKNWPIRDGKDQARLLSSSVDNQAAGAPLDLSRQSRAGANPHRQSLALFDKPQAPVREESTGPDVKPRASAKPPQRDYHDLFAAGAELPEGERPMSPNKEYRGAIKSGAGKNYQPIRLFEKDEEAAKTTKGIKTDDRKYEHFEFGEGEFKPKPPRHTKGQSQWDFQDFVTPSKPKARPAAPPNQQRHINWSDNEEEAQKPTVHREHNPRPRPDAERNFALTDEQLAPDATAKAHHSRNDSSLPGAGSRGKGMTESHVLDGALEAADFSQGKKPLENVTNVNPTLAKNHQKVFGSQFEIQDDSPEDRNFDGGQNEHDKAQKKPEASKRASRHMEKHFTIADEYTPAKERGINIQGDGMGSRKTGEKQWWDYE